jgi:hypothetical protein
VRRTARAVVVESTYGTQNHGPREARERQFLDRVASTVLKGGRVLVPIVAIGRAQVRARGAGVCWRWCCAAAGRACVPCVRGQAARG